MISAFTTFRRLFLFLRNSLLLQIPMISTRMLSLLFNYFKDLRVSAFQYFKEIDAGN